RRVVVALPDRCNRLRSGTNGVGAFGQIVHRFDEDFARRGVVVYDEDVQRLQSIWDDPLWGGVANLEQRSDMNGAAYAGLAYQLDLPTHYRDEPPAVCQS